MSPYNPLCLILFKSIFFKRYIFRKIYIKNNEYIYILKMKDYVKRAIDNYRNKHKESYLEYQKEQYRKRKMEDKRMKEFKVFCNIQII